MPFNTAATQTSTSPSQSSSLQELQKQPLWVWCGERVPKNQVVFFCQIFVVYCVIGAAIANLSLQQGDKQLWTILLSSCIGYLLPNPSLKFTDNNNTTRYQNGSTTNSRSSSHNHPHSSTIPLLEHPLHSSDSSEIKATLDLENE
jgi:hypothetical protein